MNARCPRCDGPRFREFDGEGEALWCLWCGRREAVRDPRRDAYARDVAGIVGSGRVPRGRPRKVTGGETHGY